MFRCSRLGLALYCHLERCNEFEKFSLCFTGSYQFLSGADNSSSELECLNDNISNIDVLVELLDRKVMK